MDWRRLRIVVTGGAGFLGKHVVEELRTRGATNITVPRSIDFDLREAPHIHKLFDLAKPDIVIHLAAVVGGIGANEKNPAKYFYDNAIMGLQLMEISRQKGIKKFVAMGTICSYPKFTPVPFKESDLWCGYPEETNASYGIAKKMMLVQAQSYRAQYGFNAIFLMPVNLYGPGDNFDPHTSHVIPAIIKKCVDAKEKTIKEIVLWGDGTPTREFLYVKDAATGICLATEHYNGSDPINLGSGEEISIKQLSEIIAGQTGYRGKIVWDTSRPNGQPKRRLDVTRAMECFGFRAQHPFSNGLRTTIDWYLKTRTQSEHTTELVQAVAF